MERAVEAEYLHSPHTFTPLHLYLTRIKNPTSTNSIRQSAFQALILSIYFHPISLLYTQIKAVMSNSGNKGVFSNNIGSSVGGFTKRNSSDAGSAGSSGSTTERRRVSLLESSCLHSLIPLHHHLLSLLTHSKSFFNLHVSHAFSSRLHFSSLE